MEVLVWLLIPVAAVVLGLLWTTWRSRDRKPADAERGMEDRERFRQAMERPLPPLHRTMSADDGAGEPHPARGAGPLA